MVKNLYTSFLLRICAITILAILFYIAIAFSKFGKVQIQAQEFNLYSSNVGIGESAPADFISPSVWVTNPSNGALVSGTVSYNAEAVDNVGVTRVEFYADNTMVGTDTSAPYSVLWDTSSFSNSLYSLFAKAFDVAGNIGTSYSISVTVDNLAPSISLTNPAGGSTVSGNVNLTSNSSDNNSVTKVEYYVDSNFVGMVGVGVTSANFPYNWSSASVSDGIHAINAKAFDAANNTTTSSAVSVTVDNNAPTVSITSPASGSNVSGIVNVKASAFDAVSVTSVEFYADGGLITTDTIAPYSTSWDTSSLSDSLHSLFAKAFDAAGNAASSSAVLVTVDNNAPTVSLTSPANGSNVSGIVNVTASASDAVSVTSVEFYADGGLITTDTIAPYSTSWDATIYSHNSSHSFIAKAYDGAGHVTTSSAVSVVVSDVTTPSVVITNPQNGRTVAKSSTVTISANASDASPIQYVEFRVNGSLKCTDASSPYSCNWKVPNRKNVTYTLKAKAFDVAGNTATHTITVTAR